MLVQYFFSEFGVLTFVIRREFSSPEVTEIGLNAKDVARYCELEFSGASLENLDLLNWEEWRSMLAPLIAPIARSTSPGETLWIVPDGVLHGLPLHALIIDGVPLIERNPICYTPSASTMVYCSRRSGTARHMVTASFGDSLSDLPSGRHESTTLAKAFGMPHLMGADVTRSNVLRVLNDGGLDLVHFACHMVFDASDPMRSGIMLAREPGDEPGAQPRLTASEILNISVQADLVLLSGCVGGLSVRKPGDELLGLSRAWLYAGTSSILASLWQVDDLASAILMLRFLSDLGLREGRADGTITKAEALQCAQMYVKNLTESELRAWEEARRQEGIDLPFRKPITGQDEKYPFANPYYWAPFVLIGDYR